MKNYTGKTALVTGASSGIGKAFATLLAERGANLIVVARTESALLGLAAELKQKYGVQIHVISCDLTEPNSASRLFAKVQNANLRVDLLINNAGFGKWGEFLDFDLKSYDSMLTLNINTLVQLCHLFLPSMVKNKEGGIINVASVAAFVPVPYAAVYSASKSFVLYFSEALYGEYRNKGVNIMALCPGGTDSNFAAVANPQVKLPNGTSETAEVVAERALKSFLKQKSYIVSGKKNYLTTLFPRFLPRQKVIEVTGTVWKKVISSGLANPS